MTPQDLKNSILQLAIQGKLVEQRPEKGVAAGPAVPKHGGKEARRHGEIEPPFDIPDNWRWVHLGDLFDIARGGSPRPIKAFLTTDENGLNWIKIGDTEKNSKYINSCREKIIPAGLSKTRQVFKGDLLLTNSMSFGRPYILNIDGCIHDGWLVLHPADPQISKDFFFYLLSSPVVFTQFQTAAAGAVVQNLNSEKVAQTLIPLPPLPEQRRIVAKIEELLPLIDRYAEAWTKLETFNKRFPEDMQKSLLQLAIQGKLVEQRPEEGTGEELYRKILATKNTKKSKKGKPLQLITEDEFPFNIPDSWRWVRLGDVADVQLGKMLDKGKNKGTPHPYLANLSVRWRSFDLSSLRTMPFTDHECEKFALLPGDVLMCEGGVPGRCAVWRQENSPIKYQKAVHRIRSAVLFPDFIQLYFEAIVENTWFADQFTGTTIKHLPRERLIQNPIPLPPLAEQKRIVAKLEELLPLCERLKGTSA